MLRKREDHVIEHRCIRGGHGEVEGRKIIECPEELCGKGRLFNVMTMQPGDTIGEHVHEGEEEIFHFLSGTAEYNDNGTWVKVGPGDTVFCRDGELHAMVNSGNEPLVFVSLIVYS